MSCWAASTHGCLDLRCCAFLLDGQVSAEWSGCQGFMGRRARDSVAPLRRSSVGWMPARIGRLSACEGHRNPVTVHKASFLAESMRQVWALWQQTRTQWYAVEWTRVRWLLATLLPQQPSPSQQAAARVLCMMSPFCEVTQGVGDMWATCPRLLRRIWARSKMAGFHWCGWLSAHV